MQGTIGWHLVVIWRSYRDWETIWIEVNVNYDITNTLPYLLKGTKVFVYGELVPKIYQSSKGAILNLKMFCDDLELCGVKPIKGDADAPLDISNDNEVFWYEVFFHY